MSSQCASRHAPTYTTEPARCRWRGRTGKSIDTPNIDGTRTIANHNTCRDTCRDMTIVGERMQERGFSELRQDAQVEREGCCYALAAEWHVVGDLHSERSQRRASAEDIAKD
jgi:hypothetical protein